MHRWLLLSLLLILLVSGGCSLVERDPLFGSKATELRTIRVSLHHGQKDGGEWFEVRSLHDEGEWNLPAIDSAEERTNGAEDLGLYRASLLGTADGSILFSYGFCSVFGEWLTTDEAKKHPDRVFEESLRVPNLEGASLLRIEKRDRENAFRQIFETTIDLSKVAAQHTVREADITVLGESDDRRNQVDIVFLSEGYAVAERDKFVGDAERLGRALLDVEPYRSLRSHIALRAVFVASPVSGVSKPDQGIERDSAFRCRYSTFGLPRYVLTVDDERVRDAASAVPYDAIVILLNDSEYGGGGIFEQYCVVAADSPLANYLLIHEFGHSFTGLGDEYYTSPVAYNDFVAKNVEPWEPNVTALQDPKDLKWRQLVDPSTELPTKWGKNEYETLQKDASALETKWRSEGAGEDQIRKQLTAWRQERLDRALSPRGVVGAFEGALYSSNGLYRPQVDCIMFRREATEYCVVCERAIRSRLLQLSK